MAAMRIPGTVLWLVAAAAVGPAAAAPEPVPVLEEHTEVHLRTLRFRVEPRHGEDPAACRDLTPAEIRVRLRGDPVADRDVLEVVREADVAGRRPITHAIVVDTSASMLDRLEFARRAATAYVEHLPSGDEALVLAFDDDVRLLQPVTADRAALLAAIDRITIGGLTSLHDAAWAAIDELSVHPTPGVLILVTDGSDTVSLHGAQRVYDRLAARPGIAVFTIGVTLAQIRAGAGTVTPKKFLGKIAGNSGGAFLDVPTVAQLDAAWARVRAMLDATWAVTVVDRDPDEPPAAEVRVRGRRCRTIRLPAVEDSAPAPVEPAERIALVPNPDRLRAAGRRARDATSCRARFADVPDHDPWFLETRDGTVEGCALDVWIEQGALYDASEIGWRWNSRALWLTTHPFRIHLPPPAALPDRPEDMLDELARRAAALPAEPPRRGARQKPARQHARPWEDADFLWHGDTWLDARETLARGLAAAPAYARWLDRQAERDAEAALARWRQELARLAPGLPADELDRVARASERGRRILERAARPDARTIEGRLGAWLGDVSAHDLFARWEAARIEEAAAAGGPVDDGFEDLWTAARELVWVPSYGRVLTPLVPGRDPAGEHIGFWRIVLPRSCWMLPRVQGAGYHHEYGRVPFDLVPPRPLAAWLWNEAIARDRSIAARAAGRPVEVGYDPLGRLRTVKPGRAFERTRVTLRFGGTGADALEIAAEIEMDGEAPGDGLRMTALEIDGTPVEAPQRAGLAPGAN